MDYQYDLFISYAHIDDLSPFGEEKGWIDLLHERLSVLITQALGSPVRIWRDGHRLQGNDDLSGAIGDGVTRSLLLVPIISPRYVQSDWCNREMEAFHAAAPTPTPTAGTAAPRFRSRVFKVVKTPLPEHLKNREPVHIRNLIGYQFYGEDEASGQLREFNPDTSDKQYWTMLYRLVADIKQTLIELKYTPGATNEAGAIAPPSTTSTAAAASVSPANVSPADVPPATADAAPTPVVESAPPPSKFVYLAETTSDLTHERELVRDELRQRGYGVLPEQKLPLDSLDALSGAVRSDLVRSALSVHLVGVKYGSTPEDDARSVVRVQEELAAERGASDHTFQRLLWMPPGLATPALEVSDARQNAFVSELQTRVAAGSELLQTSVEDLKTRVVEKLEPPAKAPARPHRRSKLKRVYLICENRDSELVWPIKEHLFKHKFEVITWLDGDEAAASLMEYHRKNLKECDAALIYFGSGDEPWVRKNIEDLEKAYGYGREEDWSASAVYVGSPPNKQKEYFLTHEVPYVIRNFDSFNPEDLREFVNAVESAEGGQP